MFTCRETERVVIAMRVSGPRFNPEVYIRSGRIVALRHRLIVGPVFLGRKLMSPNLPLDARYRESLRERSPE